MKLSERKTYPRCARPWIPLEEKEMVGGGRMGGREVEGRKKGKWGGKEGRIGEREPSFSSSMSK